VSDSLFSLVRWGPPGGFETAGPDSGTLYPARMVCGLARMVTANKACWTAVTWQRQYGRAQVLARR
jgi:hypothetical protein